MEACRKFFGVKEGQSAMDFGREVFALTNPDRVEIAAGLKLNGFNIFPETIVKK